MTTNNPFGVHNPEQVDTDYIVRNFVDIYTDLPGIQNQCNTFIHGARGTGKSMLLRSLEPEVMLKTKKATSITDLPYLAIHIPLKKTEFAILELSRFAGYTSTVLGEHMLVMYSMFRLARQMITLAQDIQEIRAQDFVKRFDELLANSSEELPHSNISFNMMSSQKIFSYIMRECEEKIMKVRQYYARLPFTSEPQPYNGPLTAFLDFLVPLAEEVNSLGIGKKPVFFMLDDADNLPVDMQRVLNTWVSTRSTRAACLKISTQLGYATYRTIDNRIIESPHDFAEVNLGTVYTTDNDRYSKRIQEIVAKRLHNANIETTPDVFFPRDQKQIEKLETIKQTILAEWQQRQESPSTGRRGPSRPNDDVTRYTIPRLMQELAHTNSSHTFSYAGFKSLVDLSGGVVRSFLEPACQMYDREYNTQENVTKISVKTQDGIIKDWSSEFFNQLDRYIGSPPTDVNQLKLINDDTEANLHTIGHDSFIDKDLKNVIDSLGRLFRKKLLDPHASEQRVFSIVVRGNIPINLKLVLDHAVRRGYLQRSDNASKEAIGGRLPRYILARRLAPHYKLDVSGYAAHLSVTETDLALALINPDEFLKRRLNPKKNDDSQHSFDFEGLDNNEEN